MNTASWIVLGVLVTVVVLVIIVLFSTKEKGGCCGCNRTDCPNCKKK